MDEVIVAISSDFLFWLAISSLMGFLLSVVTIAKMVLVGITTKIDTGNDTINTSLKNCGERLGARLDSHDIDIERLKKAVFKT